MEWVNALMSHFALHPFSLWGLLFWNSIRKIYVPHFSCITASICYVGCCNFRRQGDYCAMGSGNCCNDWRMVRDNC
ncbi:Uncharacterised protein [Citrobacter freundii]|nr:Uncharacterised protein [Citrobacter freundii]